MPRPHAAAIVEDAWNRRVAGVLEGRGWTTRIIPHVGYGSAGFVRILGRVVLSRPAQGLAAGIGARPRGMLRDADEEIRGWRNFIAAPAMNEAVEIDLNGRSIPARTDRGGLIDVTVRGHGLAPGWHQLTVRSPDATDAPVPVLVVGTTQRFGIISDIDDTILSTSLPRPMIAAWNTFAVTEGARRAVPGMATMYREILAAHPGTPVVYVSTGAWNTATWLRRFVRRNGYPTGPMLLTDWGATQTGWFRSGQDHKRACLHRLAREFPQVRWLLVGDDGQHDPKLYTEFATKRPEAVRAIAIRQLSTGEQVLSHGLPVANDQLLPAPTEGLSMPVVRGPDGFSLARQLRPVLRERGPSPLLATHEDATEEDW